MYQSPQKPRRSEHNKRASGFITQRLGRVSGGAPESQIFPETRVNIFQWMDKISAEGLQLTLGSFEVFL